MPNFVVHVRVDVVYAYGWSSWLFRTIWKVKRAPKRAYALFRRFSCAIAHHFWVIGIRRQKCQICSWTSVKTLSKHTVGHHGFSDPFGRSNELRSEHTPHFDDFRVLLHTIFWVIEISTSKMSNLFVEVRQDVVYVYGWPSRLFRPIWKVKRAPKRAYASF